MGAGPGGEDSRGEGGANGGGLVRRAEREKDGGGRTREGGREGGGVGDSTTTYRTHWKCRALGVRHLTALSLQPAI